MTHNELLQASCRVALAGLLHDIGKFAERAKIEAERKDVQFNEQWYCPKREENGRIFYTHKHAAARHHTPETFLQWIIATADRVASGFERTEFDEYNKAEEKNHYQSRQLTLFEQIHIDEEKDRPKKDIKDFNYRYSLKPLSPESIFPVKAEKCERNNNQEAQNDYKKLWDQFIEGLKDIPESHRHNLALWLDHFDSCWQTFTHTIPSATAFNTKPDVSLYDHSKAVTAIATALWRYHRDRNDNQEIAKKKMSAIDKKDDDWNEEKLLLIQADFFGIQNFIFAHGGDSTKKAAKLLRGRSFYVSLITECAALKILEILALPSTSQIINAAGKFLIVAPNTEETIKQLKTLQQEFNNWFLTHSYGQSGLGLAWQTACCNDFESPKDLKNKEDSKFSQLMKKLHTELERSKYLHFDLCGQQFAKPVFKN